MLADPESLRFPWKAISAMQGIRRQGRSYALQLLYQVEITQQSEEETLGRFWLTVDASSKAREFALDLVRATLKHRADIDKRLGASLENWKLARLSVVVRNVLRLAVCEMLILKDTPPPVVINEAVDLTRSFMDEESAPFVNKVLDKCLQADSSMAVGSKADRPAKKPEAAPRVKKRRAKES